jgi:hypothetical protein
VRRRLGVELEPASLVPTPPMHRLCFASTRFRKRLVAPSSYRWATKPRASPSRHRRVPPPRRVPLRRRDKPPPTRRPQPRPCPQRRPSPPPLSSQRKRRSEATSSPIPRPPSRPRWLP